MPMFQAAVRHLNRHFDEDGINAFARHADRFAPGQKLDVALLHLPDKALARRFQAYLDHLPPALTEVLRAAFSYALTASPPVPMSFSWAPGYDYELTVWQPPCGILVQFRSPTPHDG